MQELEVKDQLTSRNKLDYHINWFQERRSTLACSVREEGAFWHRW